MSAFGKFTLGALCFKSNITTNKKSISDHEIVHATFIIHNPKPKLVFISKKGAHGLFKLFLN